MGKVKAKKRSAKKPANVASVAPEKVAEGKEHTFISRDKSAEVKMTAPVKKNNASEADSYSAHFINRKGKNACGASNVANMLVVNGIADELKAVGVKGIIQPTQKPYQAIKLNGWDKAQLKELADKIATVLGFTRKTKAPTTTAKAGA